MACRSGMNRFFKYVPLFMDLLTFRQATPIIGLIVVPQYSGIFAEQMVIQGKYSQCGVGANLEQDSLRQLSWIRMTNGMSG